MNILIIYQYHIRPNDAGISRFAQFAKHWSGAGHKVKIIAGMIKYFSGEKPSEYKRKLWVKESEDSRITVLRTFTSAWKYYTFWGRILSYLSFIISSLIAGLLSAKPDIIIASSPAVFIGLVGYIISFVKRIPFVFEIRDLWPDEPIELGVIKNQMLIKFSYALEKFLYKHAKLIIALTPAFKEFLIKEKGVAPDKIEVIPNSVDLTTMNPQNKNNRVRQKFNWRDKFIVSYIGSYSFVYDFSPILETARNLKDRYQNIIFILIGAGRQKSYLIERAKKEYLTNVRFLEPVPKKQIGDYINASDVCTATLKNMKYLRYVYAAKLFDYMACGKPIILAMNGVSNRLICSESNSGICIEPENAQAFQSAVLELYYHPDKRALLGRNGYEFVKKNFSYKHLAVKYEGALKNILR